MTKPWTERRDEAADKFVFECPKYSGYPEHIKTFEAGADFGYEQGKADAKAITEVPEEKRKACNCVEASGRIECQHNIMDTVRRLDGFAGANVDEPSPGDLERVLNQNIEFKKRILAIESALAYCMQNKTKAIDRIAELETQLENAKAESQPLAQIDENEIKQFVIDEMDCYCAYIDPESRREDAPMCPRCELITMITRHEETARLTLTAESENTKVREFEAKDWEHWYERMKAERDELKAEVAHFKTMEAEWDALETLHTERKALTAKLQKAKEALSDFSEHGARFDLNPTQPMGNWQQVTTFFLGYLKRINNSVIERAREALKELEGE